MLSWKYKSNLRSKHSTLTFKMSTLFLFCVLLNFSSCSYLRAQLVKIFSKEYKTEDSSPQLKSVFIGKDTNRKRINIQLKPIFQVVQPTDIQFPPDTDSQMIILEKKGKMILYDWNENKSKELVKVDVISESEQGLLGIAFHPNFQNNGNFYLNYNKKIEESDYSIVEEWKFQNAKDLFHSEVAAVKIIMEVKQPYANHNAGQLAFGPDGMMYIGWGDGGWRADPENNGQNPKTFLGSMLRIDVNKRENEKPYAIPSDNPFTDSKAYKPEIWAIGLRNPWRYSFSPDGRLIASDVGQDKWEEINIIDKGKNYGWNVLEGFHCFVNENCDTAKYAPPVYEYDREEGNCVTGGYVYTGKEIPELSGKYVFGDFITGRIWAFDLPITSTEKVKEIFTLGKWNILISTFGRDNKGEIYASDYQTGKIFKIYNDYSNKKD
ncbi:MAG: PQQ-dependent sugar dehydrogenase [Leptospiraceae bacterium]|nr:PQQ-dependent sugar dehydrogenase [Leptospiraceae bacterium]MCP5496057.1 PQQ-dependent sugar dehydrogenase [Leptospiraceae bacterium]